MPYTNSFFEPSNPGILEPISCLSPFDFSLIKIDRVIKNVLPASLEAFYIGRHPASERMPPLVRQSRTADRLQGALILRNETRVLKNVQFCSRSRKRKILTTGIHIVFRGLKFESDAEIGQKGMFFIALETYIGVRRNNEG